MAISQGRLAPLDVHAGGWLLLRVFVARPGIARPCHREQQRADAAARLGRRREPDRTPPPHGRRGPSALDSDQHAVCRAGDQGSAPRREEGQRSGDGGDRQGGLCADAPRDPHRRGRGGVRGADPQHAAGDARPRVPLRAAWPRQRADAAHAGGRVAHQEERRPASAVEADPGDFLGPVRVGARLLRRLALPGAGGADRRLPLGRA
mmetsp:Transcript_33597/g.108005  ORF Transcript_33597/g.108005 Transcript_33597/m.108005 type:complete len:206 (-) Transcript_33597:739-1356(-)